jgi:hypothetical protein
MPSVSSIVTGVVPVGLKLITPGVGVAQPTEWHTFAYIYGDVIVPELSEASAGWAYSATNKKAAAKKERIM